MVDGFMKNVWMTVSKMNRSIHGTDIKEYSDGLKPDGDVESTIQEEMEYKEGKLEHSTGYMMVEMVNTSKEEYSNEESLNDQQPSLSRAFSARGQYELTLQECFEVSKKQRLSQKRMIQSRIKHGIKEGLRATIDSSKLNKICYC